MNRYKAFIFDLNGTMVNDMPYHIKAWHDVLNGLGANLTMDETKEQCYGKNDELLERVFPGKYGKEEKDKIGYGKEVAYQRDFKSQLKLVDGLDLFLAAAAEANIKMAIGSAAITFNIDYVLDGLHIRHYFDAIVSAEDVEISKPHPETFLKAAERLHVAIEDCLVFEDTPKGVETALNAGMKAVLITTLHQAEEFENYPNIIRFSPDFTDLMELI